MDAFLLSFAVIFVAELGDKSQLIALALATRYRATHVLIGITLATLLVHLGSVILGHTVAAVLPTQAIAIAAGIAFFVFALWTLRGDSLGEAGKARHHEHVADFGAGGHGPRCWWELSSCLCHGALGIPASRSAPDSSPPR